MPGFAHRSYYQRPAGAARNHGRDGHRRPFYKNIAKVPLSEMYDYSSSLRSITQGRAKFRMHFHEYTPVAFEIQKKLIDEYHKTVREEVHQ